MSKPINTLMQKEMSRKEFLATSFFGIAALMGFSSIIGLFTGKSAEQRISQHTGTGLGYGGGPYGK